MKNLIQLIGIGIFLCLIIVIFCNHKEVISARDMEYYNFIKQCQEGCKDYSCYSGCSFVSRDYRDATKYFAVSSIIEHITGGLAITTANILDATIGGIVFIIKKIKNVESRYFYDGNNFSDITLFSDFIFENGLHYEWSILKCRSDFLSKDPEAKINNNSDLCGYFYFKDYIRIATNIVVCIIFICLVIRICSFNFRDGIFEIIGGRK